MEGEEERSGYKVGGRVRGVSRLCFFWLFIRLVRVVKVIRRVCVFEFDVLDGGCFVKVLSGIGCLDFDLI